MVWKFATNNEVVGSPAIDSAGRVFIGSEDESFYCLNATTGSLKAVPPFIRALSNH